MAEPLVSSSRLRALRSAFGNGDKPILLTIHDYPDPDAIAAAMAIQTLAGSWGISAVIVHGGIVGRAENMEMIRLLKIDLRTFASIPDLAESRGAVFLDTQPIARNQSLPENIPVLAVIDHHVLGDESVRLTALSATGTTRIIYSDVRADVGASSTLALGYLEAAGIVPDSRLATALFLGIKTDTDGLLRNANPADISAYVSLLPLCDMKLAAQVIHPPLDQDQYVFMRRSVERAIVYGSTLLSCLDDVSSPDLLSAASDYLINLRGLNYALAVGFNGDRAYMSLRAKPGHANATSVLLKVVEPEGKGGGHGLSAGGFTELAMPREQCLTTLRTRLLDATGDLGFSGMPLITDDLTKKI